jgi:hypothetical protein
MRLLQLGVESLGQARVGSQQTAPSAYLPFAERLLPGGDLDGGRGRHDGSCYKGLCYPEHSSVGATFRPSAATAHDGFVTRQAHHIINGCSGSRAYSAQPGIFLNFRGLRAM